MSCLIIDCFSILLQHQGAWRPSLNISTVLASIGLLLGEPNPDDGLVTEVVSARGANQRTPRSRLSYTSFRLLLPVIRGPKNLMGMAIK